MFREIVLVIPGRKTNCVFEVYSVLKKLVRYYLRKECDYVSILLVSFISKVKYKYDVCSMNSIQTVECYNIFVK